MLSVSIGSAIMPAYIKDLGGSDAVVGYVISTFFLVRGSLTILAGAISDRIDRRKLLIVSLALFSISQALYILCQKPWHVTLCAASQATAAGIYWPTILSYIASTSKPGFHARDISQFFVLVGLGGFLGSWSGGYVAEIYSPRISYLLGCIVFVVPLAMSACLTQEGKSIKTDDKVALREVFSAWHPLFGLIMLASVSIIPRASFWVGYALRLRSLGGTYSTIGNTYGISMLIGLINTALVPKWGRYIGLPKLILISMSICAFSALANGLAPSLWIPCVLLPLLWGAVMMGEVSWITYVQSESATKTIGMATGLLRGTMDLAALLYSSVFGLLSDRWGVGGAFIFSALGILVIFEVTRRFFSTQGK